MEELMAKINEQVKVVKEACDLYEATDPKRTAVCQSRYTDWRKELGYLQGLGYALSCITGKRYTFTCDGLQELEGVE